MPKNILIYTHMSHFEFNNGGTVAKYNLARMLEDLSQTIRIYSRTGICINNSIFNKFYNNDFPIDDNCVVIYCEGTQGNPLNAKNVVRWILSELGKNVPTDWVHEWGKNELVYYFNSETKFITSPEKLGTVYKFLNCIYINPYAKQTNFEERKGICYTIRKARQMHNNISLVHPKGSFEITREHNQMQCIEFFNTYKWFMCYNPLTFYIIIAALCGCIPVVYKMAGLTKQQWIQTTVASEYLKVKDWITYMG